MIPTTFSAVEIRIKQLLIDDLQVDAALLEQADITTPLLGRGIGLDSVEAMRLGLGLENAFDISIADADLNAELFSSIGHLANYVEQKIARRAVTTP